MLESWRKRGWEQREEKIRYDEYRLSWKEILRALCGSAAATCAFAYMFYQSWIGCLAWPAVAALWLKGERQKGTKQRKERLSAQFGDAISAAAAGMQAGYSVENAFLEAEGEIRSLYGEESEMARELADVRKGLKNGIPLEQMIQGLGDRSGVEEIRDFAEAFAAAKRMGGNLRAIVLRTVELTRQRMEVEQEIRAILAARKYEQKVMTLIPFFLFAYLQLSSPGFFDVLYHNGTGQVIMTAALALYLSACGLSARIMDIRV